MKVVLINPPSKRVIGQYEEMLYPNIGLAYLAAYLEKNKIRCSVIDSEFERIDIREAKRRLLKEKPDIVGITALTYEIKNVANFASIIKQNLPNCIIVIGGVHVTTLPIETMEKYPEFDIAIYGEGERTLYELITAIKDGKSLKGIKGVVFRNNNEIIKNSPRQLLSNLDELPFPAWHKFPRSKEYPILGSRGCPFKCIFCTRPFGETVRYRSPKNVIKELEIIVKKYQPEEIFFHDQTFTLNRRRIFDLSNLIIEKKLNKKIKWWAQTRVDMIDFKLLKKMKDAGCRRIGLGIESGNNKILKIIKKYTTVKQALEAVKLAKKVGLKTDSYFILGHPFETLKTINDTIDLAIKLNTSKVGLAIMTPYPGTGVMKMAKKGIGGYRLLSEDWSDYKQLGNVLELKQLSREDLERLRFLGYLKFYIYNLRLVDFLKFIIRYVKIRYIILIRKYQRFIEKTR